VFVTVVIIIIIIIIIIIFRYDCALKDFLSASSNSLFRGFPSRVLPFGLQFSIIFGILLLFILVTLSQFNLHLLSFSSIGSNLTPPHSFCGQKGVPSCSSEKNSYRLMSVGFFLFFYGLKFRFHIKELRDNFIIEIFCTKIGLKVLFRIPSIWENFAGFCWISFSFT
jgi:hypothetical protein